MTTSSMISSSLISVEVVYSHAKHPSDPTGHIVAAAFYNGNQIEYLDLKRPSARKKNSSQMDRLTDILESDADKISSDMLNLLLYAKQNGITVRGQLHDLLIRESLASEHQQVTYQYLIDERKLNDKPIKDAAHWLYYQNDPSLSFKSLPSLLLQQYTETLAFLSFHIYNLPPEGLSPSDPVYNLEMRLLRPLAELQHNGIRVDTDELENFRQIVSPHAGHLNDETKENILKSSIIQFDALQAAAYNGRIRTSYHQVKKNGNGARTGRIQTTNPNLQGMPVRPSGITFDGVDLHSMARCCLLPNHQETFYKLDYSQIEYRLLAHFAVGPGAEDLRRDYYCYPKYDAYSDIISALPGVERNTAKVLNLAHLYGQSAEGMAKEYGWTIDRCKEIRNCIEVAAPYILPTAREAKENFKTAGYVRTLLGRKVQPDPNKVDRDEGYAALNSLLQGSAADILKTAVVHLYENGLFDKINPLLLVHDEIDFSVAKGKEFLIEDVKRIMENCVELKVPLKVDVEHGRNWFMEELPDTPDTSSNLEVEHLTDTEKVTEPSGVDENEKNPEAKFMTSIEDGPLDEEFIKSTETWEPPPEFIKGKMGEVKEILKEKRRELNVGDIPDEQTQRLLRAYCLNNFRYKGPGNSFTQVPSREGKQKTAKLRARYNAKFEGFRSFIKMKAGVRQFATECWGIIKKDGRLRTVTLDYKGPDEPEGYELSDAELEAFFTQVKEETGYSRDEIVWTEELVELYNSASQL